MIFGALQTFIIFRWVSSHKIALDRIFRNYKAIVLHLEKIRTNPKDFGTGAVNQATDIRPFFMASSTLIIIVFQIDVIIRYTVLNWKYYEKWWYIRKSSCILSAVSSEQVGSDKVQENHHFMQYLSFITLFKLVIHVLTLHYRWWINLPNSLSSFKIEINPLLVRLFSLFSSTLVCLILQSLDLKIQKMRGMVQ